MAIPTQDGRSVMITNEEQESIERFFNAVEGDAADFITPEETAQYASSIQSCAPSQKGRPFLSQPFLQKSLQLQRPPCLTCHAPQ